MPFLGRSSQRAGRGQRAVEVPELKAPGCEARGLLMKDAPDRSRSLMHGIFMGEVQALEAAGRTCWDFPTGDGSEDAPFALKLDMARQCWDESRHVEISCKLSDWMGTELGEFAEG